MLEYYTLEAVSVQTILKEDMRILYVQIRAVVDQIKIDNGRVILIRNRKTRATVPR